MDDTKIINVFHNDWNDVIIVNDTILYKKNNENNKTTDFFINNHFLKITWNDKYIDYFLSYDAINYYQYTEKYYYYFFKNYSCYFISEC